MEAATKEILVEFEGSFSVVDASWPLTAASLTKAAFKQLVPSSYGHVVSQYQLLLSSNGQVVGPLQMLTDDTLTYIFRVKKPSVSAATSLSYSVMELTPHPSMSSPTANSAPSNHALTERVVRLAEDCSASSAISLSHVEVYNRHASKLVTNYERVLGNAPAALPSLVAELWDSIPHIPPASMKEDDHQKVTQCLVSGILSRLDMDAHLTVHFKPHLGVIPDLALFPINERAVSWANIVAPWEVEAWDGTSGNTHYKEGMGQAISYMARQFQEARQPSVVGVFSNSWNIEVMRHEAWGTMQEVIYTTGLLPFLGDGVHPSSGFAALVHLLSSTPQQLGRGMQKTVAKLANGTHLALTKHLGSGGWSDVYESDINGICAAVKIRKDGGTTDSDFEALKALQGAEAPASIPLLHPLTFAERTLLITTPVGIPLSKLLQACGGAFTEAQVEIILTGVAGALRWAHARGWVHMDVRLQNVVVVTQSTRDEGDHSRWQAVLVDWTEALPVGTKRSGTCGLPLTAASELVRAGISAELPGEWLAHPSMDWESATYLYYWLVKGALSWRLSDSEGEAMILARDSAIAELPDTDMLRMLRSARVASMA